MQLLLTLISLTALFFLTPQRVFAATDAAITSYTTTTLTTISVIATSAVVLFLIRGGYVYITSTGKPDALDHAKTTIKNALIGLTLIISSTVLVSVLTNALTPATNTPATTNIKLSPLTPATQNDGVTQVFTQTITSFMQTIVQSATKPVIDTVFTFLAQTPSVLTNTTIHNFWLVILGITDSLYVIVVALLGLHLMSAATFGFEEISLKQILPRIGLSFLGSNVSLYLADYIIKTNNALVSAIITSSGGLAHAWVVDAVTFPNTAATNAKIVTLLFFILFLILAIVLLLFYVSRLIIISLASVLSPLIFLLFALPKLSAFAEIATKVYITTIFIEFVHVVTIQLAASFLAVPDNNNNSLLAIVIAIGLFATLLKIPSLMMQMIFYSSSKNAFTKIGGQVINVMTSSRNETNNANERMPIRNRGVNP